VLFCEALLRGAGLRVGSFTSPHLRRWTERFRIDGREVAGERLAGAVARLRPHVEALRREPELWPSFFDATTAAALLLFAEARLDAVVLEVGLGGRLDSTNVVTPAVACVTSLELEHTEVLGGTLAAIAAEKAGILKPGVPAVLGAFAPEAGAVVRARAEALGSPTAELGRDFTATLLEAEPLRQRVRFEDGPLRLEGWLATPGAPARTNAALAAACALRSGLVSTDRLAQTAAGALGGAALPGRVEVVGLAPLRIADSAHTPASARALADVLDALPRRRAHLVLSLSSGKDVEAICALLAPRADAATLTRADAVKSLDPAHLAGALRALAPALDARVVPNPHLALRAAWEAAAPEDLLVATGSVYLAGIAREVWSGERPAPVVVTRRAGA
jgi:dihydrofolate synthase/folylpolyglutamate synthase